MPCSRCPPTPPSRGGSSVAGGVPSLRYQFFVLRSGGGMVAASRDYSTVPIAVWTPPATGTYVVQPLVRNAGTTTGYDTYTNSGYITVGSDSPARIVTIGSDVHLPAQAGAPHHVDRHCHRRHGGSPAVSVRPVRPAHWRLDRGSTVLQQQPVRRGIQGQPMLEAM